MTQVAAASTASASGQSVTYQISQAHDGHLTGDNLYPPLTRSWSRTLDGIVSYPLIAGGRAFVTTGGGSANLIYALDLATGTTLWTRTLGGTYFWSGAAYDGDRVFVVNGDGLLRALAADSGKTLWATLLADQWSFSSEPVAADGIVYTAGAGYGGTLYAVSQVDGRVLWTQSVANGDHSSPALDATNVYVSYVGPQIYAFNRITGQPAWHYSGCCSGGGGRTSVLYDGRLFARDGSSGYVLDASSGRLVDSFSARPAPAFGSGVGLYLNGGTLRAENASTGTGLWNFQGDRGLSSAPIVASDRAYIGSATGTLYALELRTGSIVWKDRVGAPIEAPDEHNVSRPVTGLGAGQGLLLAPAGRRLVAYAGRDGPPPSVVNGSPAAPGTTNVGGGSLAGSDAGAGPGSGALGNRRDSSSISDIELRRAVRRLEATLGKEARRFLRALKASRSSHGRNVVRLRRSSKRFSRVLTRARKSILATRPASSNAVRGKALALKALRLWHRSVRKARVGLTALQADQRSRAARRFEEAARVASRAKRLGVRAEKLIGTVA
jgi:outer membrane protein assembly factor BamB